MRHGAQEDGLAHPSSASWTDQINTGSVPRQLLAQEWRSWEVWEPPRNVLQCCSCGPRLPAQVPWPRVGWKQGPVLPRKESARPWVIAASGLGDGASQEHMFPRKPGICLSQRAHPTISLSAVKVRNSFSYLPGFRKPKKKKGERAPGRTRHIHSVL